MDPSMLEGTLSLALSAESERITYIYYYIIKKQLLLGREKLRDSKSLQHIYTYEALLSYETLETLKYGAMLFLQVRVG